MFRDCICFQLGKTGRKITKHYRDSLKKYGLTHGQFFMLVAILEENGITPSQLAEKTALDRATTTGLLDRLEQADWIKRQPEPSDRRTLRIFLNEKSLHHKGDILRLFEETNAKFLNRFSRDEWRLFQSFLARLDE